MSWCGGLCDAVEDAADAVVDAAEDAVDAVTDAVDDALDYVSEGLEELGEWVEETAEDIAELVEKVATKVWDWITETASNIWDWIKKVAGDIWEWTTGALEDAWDWVKEAASDAWDWISSAASTVWEAIVDIADKIVDFIEEKVVPFLTDLFWILTHIDDFIIAGIRGLLCLLTEQDEKEYDLIEGMYMMDKEALSDRIISFLPNNNKYVIFSDHHLFVGGSELDKFRQLGNHELYKLVLASYYVNGFTLIENGDIEDLWLHDPSLGEAIYDEVTDVLGWPIGTAMEEDHEDARIRHQAVRIFDNNSDVYQTIRNLFHNNGRFVRLVGNHDNAWRKGKYLKGLQVIYPGIKVYDYAFVGNYPNYLPVYQNHPEVIIAHGHQLDAWNNSVCQNAGASITEVASGISSLATSTVTKRDWKSKLNGSGFDNQLSESLMSIDELEFFETIEKDFSNHFPIPQFVLGHTHKALKEPLIPGMPGHIIIDGWRFNEYTNDGTAGRWEQFVWCVTIENSNVNLHGWIRGDDGVPYALNFSGGYSEYLQAG